MEAFELIGIHNIKQIDLRFTDLKGQDRHITISSTYGLEVGKMFDGSSIEGWRHIKESDLMLKPDLNTACVDPFHNTLMLRCDVFDPQLNTQYEKDPRGVAKRAEQYIKQTGIADTVYFGPEMEFFLFDNIDKNYKIDKGDNFIKEKEGYFKESGREIRSDMLNMLGEVSIKVEAHHHEVARAQHEIITKYDSLLKKADQIMLFKYIVRNVAARRGKTVTFMPKPYLNDNGSGMHCNISLFKDGQNIFMEGASFTTWYFIGGILKHARALTAFTNPSTNSYLRLVPGFEAPTNLFFSWCDRSAAIRIPHARTPNEFRLEVRFPDALANPYLCFSALLMAGLDGIERKLSPVLSPHSTLPTSLEEAIECLKVDHDFLLAGDVFTSELIESHIELLEKDVEMQKQSSDPLSIHLYYNS